MNIFITGISTDVGKTIASAIVVEALQADYWKPIQAGDLHQSDTMKVQNLVTNKKTEFFAPAYALKIAASPHYSAHKEGIEIKKENINRPKTDKVLVIEGAGGLLVPINNTETIADLIFDDDSVIVVSRNYLGSINHTLLTFESLKSRGISKIGIIFNGDENVASQKIILSKAKATYLGSIKTEPYFNREIVRKYAKEIRNNLLDFLS